MDYYERALFNHVLASQDPETGGFAYHTPDAARATTASTPRPSTRSGAASTPAWKATANTAR